MCPYHLQEAGATPVQELAYGLADRDRGARRGARLRARSPPTSSPRSSGASRSSSTRASASSKRCARCARSPRCGTASARERYGVTDPKAAPLPLRHAGELARAHRGAAREQRAAHRARDARRDAVEGRPRPRRAAAVLERGARAAHAVGPAVVAAHPAGARATSPTCSSTTTCSTGRRSSRRRSPSCAAAAQTELDWVLDGGGSFAMIDEMKGRLVQSHAERVRRIESGEHRGRRRQPFTETEPSPLAASSANGGGIVTHRPRGRARAGRGDRAVARRRATQRRGRRGARALRAESPRPPRTSCPRRSSSHAPAAPSASGPARCARCSASTARRPASAASRRARRPEMHRGARDGPRHRRRRAGGPIRLLVGKPGLDGHSNGAEQIAVAARDAGHGGRLPGHPAHARRRSRPRPATRTSTSSGLSILSGSHLDARARDARGACARPGWTRR